MNDQQSGILPGKDIEKANKTSACASNETIQTNSKCKHRFMQQLPNLVSFLLLLAHCCIHKQTESVQRVYLTHP